MSLTIVVQGAGRLADVPHLDAVAERADVRFASAPGELRRALPGARVLLGWDFRAGELRDAWPAADRLEWIQWSGAGVDAVLFPALVESEVVLTNARGIYDRAMAEYVLGLVLAFAKDLPGTTRAQIDRAWRYRLTERIQGARALVVGAGSIGRSIARLLRAAGVRVEGVARAARAADPDLGRVWAVADLALALGRADYVIVVLPLTRQTTGLIGPRELAAMRPSARLINVGRGPVVDEAALIDALGAGRIAGAALDVFDVEPLPPEHALWSRPNVIVSPHMSGDYAEHKEDVGWLFRENLARFERRAPLLNVVDKRRGY